MRNSVVLSAFFLAAILLGLCGRLPFVRGDKPAVHKRAPVGEGQDPFAAPASAKKPPAASSAGESADDRNPFDDFDAAPGKAVSAPPQCVTAKTCATAKKARPQAITPSPEPSRPASMKITVGKASSRSAAAELAASEEIIEKALLKPVTLEVVETPLDKVVEQLSRQLDVNFLIDRRDLKDVGIDPATPVTCTVAKLPLRFALDELLRPLELTWTIRNGALVVTTPEEDETNPTTKVYDVSSLLVDTPDYPASRSSDLGDPDSLFGPPSDRNIPWLSGGYPVMGWSSGGGMNGVMMVGGQPDSPPTLQQHTTGLIDSITSTIEPVVWDKAGGPCHIVANQPQQLLVVHATRAIHEKVAGYLDTLRHRVETRPQIRIEAHWLWLTEPELASLLAEQDKASPAAGDVVAEAAWKKLRQQKRDDADNAAGDMVEMGAFEAILKGQNGQWISGVSGRQTRVMITLIPVVGDPPATAGGGGGMGGMGMLPPTTPASPQTPAPPAQRPPTAAQTYPPSPPGVGYQPVCRTIQEGGALEVRPCVVAEGKEILLDLRSRFVQREDNPDAKPQAPAAGVAAGANRTVAAGASRAAARSSADVVRAIAAAVDRPQIRHYRLETTLRVPADRRVLVGGLTYSEPSADEINLHLFVKATVVSGPSQTDR